MYLIEIVIDYLNIVFMHIEYIALFCEFISVFVGFRLTTYVCVVGTTTSMYYVLDEMSGLLPGFWKVGMGSLPRKNFPHMYAKLYNICLLL